MHACMRQARPAPTWRDCLPLRPLAHAIGHRSPAEAEEATALPAPAGVRLMGGLSPTTGRLEVLINGTTWATVCRWAATDVGASRSAAADLGSWHSHLQA